MMVVPGISAVATPLEPDALLMVATVVSEEAQVAEVVTFWLELSV